jgi:diacylglycerol kinase (ATP)
LESCCTDQIPRQVKVIFNPAAGVAEESPGQLMEVISQLQSRGYTPEVYLVGPDCDLVPVVEDALQRGIRMFVVCGGDGTIETVAAALVNTPATLGIIPTGTRNNVALSLGIPEDISTAVRLLHQNKPFKIDVGEVVCCGNSRIFLETCSIGLLSALFPAADDIQHGNLARIGDFLTTLITAPSAEIRLTLDNQLKISAQAHAVLIANLPYVGPHYPIVPDGSFDDGLLDLLIFSDQSKLDLISNVVQIAAGGPEDPRIRRYHARKIDIETEPAMPAFADGFTLGEGPLSVGIKQCALAVISGLTVSGKKIEVNIPAPKVGSNLFIEV